MRPKAATTERLKVRVDNLAFIENAIGSCGLNGVISHGTLVEITAEIQ
jgi:hypothetical protein